MDDGIGLDGGKDGVDGGGVGDVGFVEGIARVGGNGRQVFEVAGVGEGVHVGEAEVAGGGQGEADESGADEAGASGDEQFHLYWSSQS